MCTCVWQLPCSSFLSTPVVSSHASTAIHSSQHLFPFSCPPQVVDLNLAHRALKGRTAAVAAVLRAYDELVSLGGAWKGTLYCTAVLAGVAAGHDGSRFAWMIATVREKRITRAFAFIREKCTQWPSIILIPDLK